jgi:RNA polymerase sigma-70 factor (sigma-E family)
VRDSEDRDFVEYVSARLPALHRAAYLLCGDGHRADDIVSSTLAALYRHWRRARAADNLDAYVQRMLARKYLDDRRLIWSRVWLVPRLPDRAAGAESGIEVRDELVTALSRLPVGQRTVVVLRFLYDMSVEDVAGVMRCTSGNVKSQASRGLATLRRLLGADELPTRGQARGDTGVHDGG